VNPLFVASVVESIGDSTLNRLGESLCRMFQYVALIAWHIVKLTLNSLGNNGLLSAAEGVGNTLVTSGVDRLGEVALETLGGLVLNSLGNLKRRRGQLC
jgi:hypothetical protein